MSKVLVHEIRGTRFWDTQQRLRNVQKKRDSRAEMFFCQSKPIIFLLFAVAVAKIPYC